jgi:hypothetical protein
MVQGDRAGAWVGASGGGAFVLPGAVAGAGDEDVVGGSNGELHSNVKEAATAFRAGLASVMCRPGAMGPMPVR